MVGDVGKNDKKTVGVYVKVYETKIVDSSIGLIKKRRYDLYVI